MAESHVLLMSGRTTCTIAPTSRSGHADLRKSLRSRRKYDWVFRRVGFPTEGQPHATNVCTRGGSVVTHWMHNSHQMDYKDIYNTHPLNWVHTRELVYIFHTSCPRDVGHITCCIMHHPLSICSQGLICINRQRQVFFWFCFFSFCVKPEYVVVDWGWHSAWTEQWPGQRKGITGDFSAPGRYPSLFFYVYRSFVFLCLLIAKSIPSCCSVVLALQHSASCLPWDVQKGFLQIVYLGFFLI